MMKFDEMLISTILGFLRKHSNYSSMSLDYQQFASEYSSEQVDFHVGHCLDEGYVTGNRMANGKAAVLSLTPKGLRVAQGDIEI